MSDPIYDQLQAILVNTYAADRNLRMQAEEDLKSFLSLNNSFNGFLGMCTVPSINTNVKMAAVLTLKNNSRKFWTRKDPVYVITDAEKALAKSTLMGLLMVETHKPLRGLFAEVMKAIVEHEFPDRWPELVPTLVDNLRSSDRLTVYNSLIALRKLVKLYEYKDVSERKVLYDVIIAVFPTLQILINSLLHENSIEVAMVFHQTFKIFYSCTMYRLPGPETSAAVDINFWFQFMSFIIEKQLPEPGQPGEPSGQPTNPDERKQWPWWKAKKWSSRCVALFIARYGNPDHASADNHQFATFFKNTTAPMLLGPVMNCLAIKSRGGYITEEVHRQCLGFMKSSIEMAPTYKLIKAHLDFVLFDMIMPTLSLSDSDIELFNNDPVEFVRKVNNPTEDWLDPRVAATDLLESLVHLRTKDTMGRVLAWFTEKLAIYDQEPDMHKKNYKLKDAILVAMCTIARVRIHMFIIP
jgi:importin-7